MPTTSTMVSFGSAVTMSVSSAAALSGSASAHERCWWPASLAAAQSSHANPSAWMYDATRRSAANGNRDEGLGLGTAVGASEATERGVAAGVAGAVAAVVGDR